MAQHKPLNNYTVLIHYHLSCTSTSFVILVGIVVQTLQLQNLYYLTYITEDNLKIKIPIISYLSYDTKPVISVNLSKLRFIHKMKAE